VLGSLVFIAFFGRFSKMRVQKHKKTNPFGFPPRTALVACLGVAQEGQFINAIKKFLQ
jgi:hypothetical protein